MLHRQVRRVSMWFRAARSLLPAAWPFAAVVALTLGYAPPAAADDLTARVVEVTNMERQRVGLAPLVYNPQLAAAAQTYAQVLASGSCWAHTCGPVPDFTQRTMLAGYTGWSVLGENIAGGQRAPEAVVAGWMASPAHRANILNSNFREIGVGVAYGGRYQIYWTEEFGARRGTIVAPPPLLLDEVVYPDPDGQFILKRNWLDQASNATWSTFEPA